MNYSENQVVELLRKVTHPVSAKDIITLNLVNNLMVEGKKISFTLEFPGFNDPLKSSLKKACIKLLQDELGQEAEVSVEVKTALKPVEKQKRQFLPEVRNIIAVASLKDLAAIIIVKGLTPESETIEKSNSENIPVLSTNLDTFNIAGRLFELLRKE